MTEHQDTDAKAGSVLIIGAGIVGANIAYQMARAGRSVQVIDAIGPHAGASGRSWAWINAVAAETEAYTALRLAGVDAYHRLEKDLSGKLEIDWTGSVLWDPYLFDPAIPFAERPGMASVDGTRLKELEPLLDSPPALALASARDGLVDGAHAVQVILTAAMEAGARLVTGQAVDALVVAGDALTGVRCGEAILCAETVILAAGTGTAALLAGAERMLPTANRAGLLITTKPISKRLQKAIWTETVHVKQLRCGRLVIGEGAHEDGALSDPESLAGSMIARAETLLPKLGRLEIEKTSVATRPIPGDGLPAIGPVPGIQGLYMAVMHSGFTLAAIAGELVTAELNGGGPMPLLDPFRPDRFPGMMPQGGA